MVCECYQCFSFNLNFIHGKHNSSQGRLFSKSYQSFLYCKLIREEDKSSNKLGNNLEDERRFKSQMKFEDERRFKGQMKFFSKKLYNVLKI